MSFLWDVGTMVTKEKKNTTELIEIISDDRKGTLRV